MMPGCYSVLLENNHKLVVSCALAYRLKYFLPLMMMSPFVS